MRKQALAALLALLLLLTGCAAPTEPLEGASATSSDDPWGSPSATRSISSSAVPSATRSISSSAVPSATRSAAPPRTERTSGVGFFFDTVVTVTLYGADETLMDDIWTMCRHYENLLSKTIAGSDVDRINQARGETVTVDAETWSLLQAALTLNQQTEGAFAVTIAPLTAQWDFTDGTNRMPTEEERLAALPLVDDTKVILGENCTVTLPAGMQIDLGGIAKGFIADKVAALVRPRCLGAMLSLGGNTYAVGQKPDGTLYGIGIQDPFDPSGISAVVRLTDRSVVTSGIYERGFDLDGVRYHHILTPWTGLPADTDLAGATILSESSMEADAWATACIVWGSEKAAVMLEKAGLPAVLILRDGTIRTVGAVQDYGYSLYP